MERLFPAHYTGGPLWKAVAVVMLLQSLFIATYTAVITLVIKALV